MKKLSRHAYFPAFEEWCSVAVDGKRVRRSVRWRAEGLGVYGNEDEAAVEMAIESGRSSVGDCVCVASGPRWGDTSGVADVL